MLALPGIRLVTDLLAVADITMHIDSPETALLAACYTRKLPVLLASDGSHVKQDTLISLNLPSDIVCATGFDQLTRLLRSRRPEAVFVRPGITPETIIDCFEIVRDDVAFVFVGFNAVEILPFIEALGLDLAALEGQIYILVRPGHAFTHREILP